MSEPTIAGVTRTICHVLGIDCADERLEAPFAQVIEQAAALGIERCQRVLLYAPDAVGRHLCDAYAEVVEPVGLAAPILVPVASVVPPVTPVCFATMFSGYGPAIHGISAYTKPVVRCETLFDRLLRAGKRVAIVAVHDSSIDLIFRDRPLDYFSERYDPEVTDRTQRLVEADNHDVIVSYHQEYDDTLHRTTPRSAEAIAALQSHVASFVRLAQAVERSWGAYDRVLGFIPDHGGHIDPATGTGTHGRDIPEDMDVRHFYGVFPGRAIE